MQTIKFSLTGSKADIETALAGIAALPGVAAIHGTPEPVVGSVLMRGRQNQVELFECIVSVVLGLASSAIYDGMKAAVAAIANKQNVAADVVKAESDPQ